MYANRKCIHYIDLYNYLDRPRLCRRAISMKVENSNYCYDNADITEYNEDEISLRMSPFCVLMSV